MIDIKAVLNQFLVVASEKFFPGFPGLREPDTPDDFEKDERDEP